jgi:hypothetical protein
MGAGKKMHLLSNLYLKTIIALPRQARDKQTHRESTQKTITGAVSEAYPLRKQW